MGKGKGVLLRWIVKVTNNFLILKVKSLNQKRIFLLHQNFKKSIFKNIILKSKQQKLPNKLEFQFKFIFKYKPFLKGKYWNNCNKIFLKNFFFLILFLEFNMQDNDLKLQFFLKKNKKNQNKISIIRAPQRNKNSQIKIKKNNYLLILNFFSFIKKNFKIKKFFLIKYYFFFFESSLFFLKNFKLSILFNDKNCLILYC